MDISVALDRMSMDKMQSFLNNKKIEVSFGFLGIRVPQLSWKHTGLEGSLTCDQLDSYIIRAYDREMQVIANSIFSQEWSSVQKGKELLTTARSIRNLVYEKAKNSKYMTSFAIDYNGFNTMNPEIEKFSHKLDQDAKKFPEPEPQEDQFFTFFPGFGPSRVFNVFSDFFDHNHKPQAYTSYTYTNIPNGRHNRSYEQRQVNSEPNFDPYKELGLEHGASSKDIKNKYRELVLKYHPDKNANDPKATEKFQKIQKAYELLK